MLTVDVWETPKGWRWAVLDSGSAIRSGGPLPSRRDAQAAAAAALADSF